MWNKIKNAVENTYDDAKDKVEEGFTIGMTTILLGAEDAYLAIEDVVEDTKEGVEYVVDFVENPDEVKNALNLAQTRSQA